MTKGRWSRSHAPRSKFVITSVTIQESDLAHTLAAAMGLTISAMMRLLIQEQFYRLSTGTYAPIPEQSLDLKVEVENEL